MLYSNREQIKEEEKKSFDIWVGIEFGLRIDIQSTPSDLILKLLVKVNLESYEVDTYGMKQRQTVSSWFVFNEKDEKADLVQSWEPARCRVVGGRFRQLERDLFIHLVMLQWFKGSELKIYKKKLRESLSSLIVTFELDSSLFFVSRD